MASSSGSASTDQRRGRSQLPEKERVFVAVVANDFTVLHPCQVLYRTRDANSDVEVRRNDLSGLTNLIVVRHKTRVNGTREAPMAAFSLSAMPSSIVVTVLHRPDHRRSRQGPTSVQVSQVGHFFADKLRNPGIVADAQASTAALPPEAGTASKAVAPVITFFGSDDERSL